MCLHAKPVTEIAPPEKGLDGSTAKTATRSLCPRARDQTVGEGTLAGTRRSSHTEHEGCTGSKRSLWLERSHSIEDTRRTVIDTGHGTRQRTPVSANCIGEERIAHSVLRLPW